MEVSVSVNMRQDVSSKPGQSVDFQLLMLLMLLMLLC
jgi:hypothetical protein